MTEVRPGDQLIGRALTGQQFARLVGPAAGRHVNLAPSYRGRAQLALRWAIRAAEMVDGWPAGVVRIPSGGTDVNAVFIQDVTLDPWVQVWVAPRRLVLQRRPRESAGPIQVGDGEMLLRWIPCPSELLPIPPAMTGLIRELGEVVAAQALVDLPAA